MVNINKVSGQIEEFLSIDAIWLLFLDNMSKKFLSVEEERATGVELGIFCPTEAYDWAKLSIPIFAIRISLQ